jgi:hypothetical protein
MKKTMIFAALILTSATAAMAQSSQEESRRIANYYAAREGFRILKVEQAGLSLASLVCRADEAAECADNVQLLVLENYHGNNPLAENALFDARVFCDRYGYDELSTSEQDGCRTQVYGRYAADGEILGVVVIERSGNGSLDIAFLHGEISDNLVAGIGHKINAQTTMASL